MNPFLPNKTTQNYFSWIVVTFLLLTHLGIAQTFNYGTGLVTGNIAPFAAGNANVVVTGNDVTVVSSTTMTAGTYNFANLTINAGVTITVTGTGAPLIIRCTGTFINNGILSVNGSNGVTPANGTTATNPTPIVIGVAGGGNSGRGGGPASGGTANRATIGSPFGSSTGGGLAPCSNAAYTVPSWGGPGGGGGSYASAGTAATGGGGQSTGCAAGGGAGTGIYGDPTLTTQAGAAGAFFSAGQTTAGDRWILGGSGGAGGAGTQSILASARAAGGSGGTGGGAVQIAASTILIGVDGIVRARGGNGGNGNISSGSNAAGGGGGAGSGGTINIQYMNSYTNNNADATLRLDVRGGLGGGGAFGSTGTGGNGGNGGNGRLLVEQDIMLCTPPTSAPTSFSSGSITASAGTINWTRGNGDRVLVVLNAGGPVSGGPVSGNLYTANSVYGSGDATSGSNYAVYDGTGSSVNISGLLPNTNYHAAIYEYFTIGNGCYFQTALTGNFTTSNGPMTYISSQAVQQTGNSPLGSTDQPILQMQVVGGPGTSPALNVSSITFNTTGTTNTADLTGARIYFTGSSATFSTATPYGASINNPSGTHSITGTQSLNPGVNYFWLVYDVSIAATAGNLMDAQFTSVNIGSAQTPSVTNPAGTRTITSLMSLSCGYTYTNFAATWTSNVGQPGTSVIASGAAGVTDIVFPGQNFPTDFQFEFNGNVYTSFGISSKGYVWFGGTNPSGLSFTPISSGLAYQGAISAFGADIVGHSASTTTPQITVRYTGTAPNRVCTIEWTAFRPWNNTGGLCPGFGSPTDWNRYDFQLKLYEDGGTNANRVEIILRDMNAFCINGNGITGQVGMRGNSNADFINRSQAASNTTNTSHAAGTLATQTIAHGANNYFNGNIGIRYTPTFQSPQVTPSPNATNICPDVTALLTTTSPVAARQWYRDNLPLTGETATTYSADASGTHIVVVSQGGCSKVSTPVNVSISSCGPVTWTGLSGTDWHTPGNWNPNTIPSAGTPTAIPNVINKPIISSSNASVGTITISPGATLTIQSGRKLTLSGNWISLQTTGAGVQISGPGEVEFSSASHTSEGITAMQNVSFIGNHTVQSGVNNRLDVRGRVNLKSGVLTTNNNFRLISLTANSGYIDDFSSGHTGSISGDVTVQRFIASGVGYRYVSSPIAPSANLNVTHFGSAVTGANGVEFDPQANYSPIGFPTCWRYDETYTQTDSQWGWISATNATNLLERGKGYALILSSNYTIGLTGPVNTGSFSGPVVSNTPSGNPISDGHNLIGNPYPSPIRWSSLHAINNGTGAGEAGLIGVMSRWLSSGAYSGTYGTINSDGIAVNGLTDTIAVAQSFIVKRGNVGSGTIAFNNSVRTSPVNNPGFYESTPVENLLRLKISSQQGADEAVIYFSNAASNGYDPDRDAVKEMIQSSTVPNLFSLLDQYPLAINALGAFQDYTIIPLGIKSSGNPQVTIEALDLSTFNPTASIYLEDRENNQFVNLRTQSQFICTVGSGIQSGRFFIHFHLPIAVQSNDAGCAQSDGSLSIQNPSGKTWMIQLQSLNGANINAVSQPGSEEIIAPLATGSYTLHLSDTEGYTSSRSITVHAPTLPDVAFSSDADAVLMTGQTIIFTALNESNTSYTWSMGDGEIIEGNSEISYAYALPGIYEVSLTATNQSCTFGASMWLTIEGDLPTGMSQGKDPLRIVAFPIPANDALNLVWNNPNGRFVNANLIDASGRIVSRHALSDMQNHLILETKTLNAGLYTIVFEGQSELRTVRVTIQH